MKAQNHGDGTDCTGQHYQAEGVLGFAFLSGRLTDMEQNQNLPKEVSNSMLGGNKKLVPHGNGPV